MVRHIVLTKFGADVSEDTIAGIYAGLATLVDGLSDANSFVGGRSESPEQIERGYHHGFTIDFDDWDALAAYANHPRHRELGAQLVANAAGGVDGILVLDIQT